MRYIIMKATIIIFILGILSCSFAPVRPDYENITKIVNIGQEVLNMEGITIKLSPVRKALRLQAQGHGSVLKAHVDMINDTTYLVSVSDLRDYEMIEVIAHELVHVRQYSSGDLKTDGNKVIYKGVKYKNITLIPYNKRPWEIDAHNQGRALSYVIKKHIRETPVDSL